MVLYPRCCSILVLDILKQNCSIEFMPRAASTIPKIQKLVEKGRVNNVEIIYSLFPQANRPDILEEVFPLEKELTLTSGPDKFNGTELEEKLKRNNITSLVIVGSAANGAVLYTASSAVLKGFDVIIPVDGMSADSAYIEQYVAWHLANAPVIGRRIQLTLCKLIEFSRNKDEGN